MDAHVTVELVWVALGQVRDFILSPHRPPAPAPLLSGHGSPGAGSEGACLPLLGPELGGSLF